VEVSKDKNVAKRYFYMSFLFIRKTVINFAANLTLIFYFSNFLLTLLKKSLPLKRLIHNDSE